MATNVSLRRLNRFFDEFNDVSFQTFFGINHFLYDFDFRLERTGQMRMLLHVIVKKKKRVYDFINLPLAISREIAEYNIDMFRIYFQLRFTPYYPFRSPIWTFELLEQNFLPNRHTRKRIRFFKQFAKKHNTGNGEWSSAFHEEKAILLLLVDILLVKERIFNGKFNKLTDIC